MSYNSSDLAVVRRAIARGERRVEFQDRSVTYRSLDELLAIEAHIARALSTGDPSITRNKQTVLLGEKGL